MPPPAASGGDVRTYTPADFARYSPTTAHDMVRNIPGFSIVEQEERRGLGQGGVNVLINGERISGKSNDAVAALGRISAANVTRIEVRDAATLNIPGLSGQVVNIVANIGAVSGTFSYNPQFRWYNTEPRLFTGEVSVNGRLGPVEYTIGLANVNDSFRNGNDGPELVYDGLGNLTDERYEVLTVYGDRPRVSGTFRIDGPGSSVGNLNLSYERYYFDAREDSDRFPFGQVARFRLLEEREREWNYEIGGDYEFALGPGRLKLIGVTSREYSPFSQQAVFSFADDSPDQGSRFTRTADETETIARGEYSWRMWGADWQYSLEGALNRLDNVSRLFILDDAGDFVEVPLPGGAAVVEEDRAEANITMTRALNPALTLQASLGAEYSTISQSGDVELTRTFYRPKGFVSLAWTVDSSLNLRARLERKVGQLDFNDFVASVNVSSGSENESNPNLVPPQTWLAEVSATKNLGPWGSITARLFHEAITDIVDQIPVGDDAEAIGNLDSATRYGIEWTSTFNFDPIGIRGAKLDLTVNVARSRLTDPLTGERRPISVDQQSYIEAEFRHDIPGTEVAYGFELERYREAPSFRLNEFGQFNTVPAFIGAYLEHKDVLGLRVRGSVFNLFGSRDDFYREVYVNRRDGPILFIEDRSRRIGPIFSLSINGTF
ncbi:MAG: TonB-dependent receptor [Sphingomonadaceae bacterium]|nr:TonB-dependent receptor [Sphingomonadaceae bacterium]